ncbi:MAG: hypothetical protein HY897_00930 [Deltaproteobacteria bacterium]|nr:hypothetical protein [Deltaproteobacteria bacterium]
MRTRLTTLLTFALAALAAPAAGAEPVRPAPKEIGRMASPIAAVRLVGGLTEGGAYLAGLDPKLRKTLEKEGHVLFGEQSETKGGTYAGYIRAVALFKGSKEQVYKLIAQPVRQPTYLPRLTGAKSVDKPANGEPIEFRVKVMWARMKFFTRHWFYPEYSRVEWALDKNHKNDIALQEGYWQLYQVKPDLTVGKYGTKVDTGVAVPQFVQDFLARQDIPKALTAFRAFIDSKGTYRRDD